MKIELILCINLPTRPDRWESCVAQFGRYGLDPVSVITPTPPAPGQPVFTSCLAAHRKALERACHFGWTLILEDDFRVLHDDFRSRLRAYLAEVPGDADLVYLGGNPRNRTTLVSPHVGRTYGMATTSSYVVSRRFAAWFLESRFYTPALPIDDCLINAAPESRQYVLLPRLVSQWPNYSDIEQRPTNYSATMG